MGLMTTPLPEVGQELALLLELGIFPLGILFSQDAVIDCAVENSLWAQIAWGVEAKLLILCDKTLGPCISRSPATYKCPSAQKYARGNRCGPPVREREQKQSQGTALHLALGICQALWHQTAAGAAGFRRAWRPWILPPGFLFLSLFGLNAGLGLIFTSESALIEVRGKSLRNINTDRLGNCSV